MSSVIISFDIGSSSVYRAGTSESSLHICAKPLKAFERAGSLNVELLGADAFQENVASAVATRWRRNRDMAKSVVVI